MLGGTGRELLASIGIERDFLGLRASMIGKMPGLRLGHMWIEGMHGVVETAIDEFQQPKLVQP